MQLPEGTAAWQAEIRSALASARATVAASDQPDDRELWHRMEDQAVARARHARGLPPLAGDAPTMDALIDQITEITEDLRRHGGGDPEDHHISEAQFFLLYYLATQVHAQVLDPVVAGTVVEHLWNVDEAVADGDDGEDEPWPIRRPPPTTPQAWFAEITAAWNQHSQPPILRTEDGSPVSVDGDDLRGTAVVMALHQRGATPQAEAFWALLGVIEEMEDDIGSMGPELANLRRNPSMMFTLYYLWTHIIIGHATEDIAHQVVVHAAERAREFADVPLPRRGSSRIRRRN